ncbi:MAG: putative toxin-antitoxin system toxin component, PIN family [Deltaproteobacteria bacterium CG_4_9_14_3_um_filter_65_9]|nr:MAG: putative toxin-antitoxin system toxin component, PIN family [Deltaproteobacteria bacterium CG_4_9_14_3_um_filter_65_9]
MRVFLDTNVLVSAFASRGLCADVVRHILAEHELLTGEVNIVELRRVLRVRIKVPPPIIASIEQLLRDQVVVPKPAKPHPLPIRDADDKWVLASAVAGNADVLVTGDADLLEMASRSSLPIVNPRGFWNMVRGG